MARMAPVEVDVTTKGFDRVVDVLEFIDGRLAVIEQWVLKKDEAAEATESYVSERTRAVEAEQLVRTLREELAKHYQAWSDLTGVLTGLHNDILAHADSRAVHDYAAAVCAATCSFAPGIEPNMIAPCQRHQLEAHRIALKRIIERIETGEVRERD